MKDLGDALTYPTQSENWVVTILIGGILGIFGFLLVPLIFVYGYIVKAIRQSTADRSAPPSFEDWGSLLVEGIQAWVIGLIYLLIPLIVGALTVGGAAVAIATGSGSGMAAGIGSLAIGLGLTLILALIFGYIAVAAIVNFSREERFGAAFDFGVLKQVLVDPAYAVPWVVSVVMFIVAGMVNVIPLIGWILSPFVGFYVAIVAADLWADGFSEALEPA